MTATASLVGPLIVRWSVAAAASGVGCGTAPRGARRRATNTGVGSVACLVVPEAGTRTREVSSFVPLTRALVSNVRERKPRGRTEHVAPPRVTPEESRFSTDAHGVARTHPPRHLGKTPGRLRAGVRLHRCRRCARLGVSWPPSLPPPPLAFLLAPSFLFECCYCCWATRSAGEEISQK